MCMNTFPPYCMCSARVEEKYSPGFSNLNLTDFLSKYFILVNIPRELEKNAFFCCKTKHLTDARLMDSVALASSLLSIFYLIYLL